MALATRLVFLTAVHAVRVWLAQCEDPRCTCVFEVGKVPEPNRAVLDLLEKQLDRCSASDRQSCPACAPCPALPLQSIFPALTPDGGAGISAWTVSLLLGMLLGRLSYMIVPLNIKHSCGNHEGDHGSRQDHYEQQTDIVKQMDNGGSDLPEDSCEAGLGTCTGRLEGESASETRGGLAQGPAGGAAVTQPAYSPHFADEADSSLCPLVEDDLEDEEKLGITDAGDEEWTEVLDVIREHSAVTIFNHTDSTWYVSSKHPHFVRPLHGKRRHPLRQSPLRQTWAQHGAITSEGQPAFHRESGITCVGAQPHAEQDPSVFKDEHGDQCSSVLPGAGLARNASSHVQRLSRRPRSAPSERHADALDGQIFANNMLQHAGTSGRRAATVGSSNDSHQRCASADPAQLSVHEPQNTDAPRTLIHDDTSEDVPGMRSGTISQTRCKFRSASPPIFEDHSYED